MFIHISLVSFPGINYRVKKSVLSPGPGTEPPRLQFVWEFWLKPVCSSYCLRGACRVRRHCQVEAGIPTAFPRAFNPTQSKGSQMGLRSKESGVSGSPCREGHCEPKGPAGFLEEAAHTCT